jgi:hypothetical protein
MHVTSHSPDSRSVDVRLLRYFAPVTVSGVLQQMNDSHTKRLRVSQFVLAEPEDSSAAIGDTDLAMLRANA